MASMAVPMASIDTDSGVQPGTVHGLQVTSDKVSQGKHLWMGPAMHTGPTGCWPTYIHTYCSWIHRLID